MGCFVGLADCGREGERKKEKEERIYRRPFENCGRIQPPAQDQTRPTVAVGPKAFFTFARSPLYSLQCGHCLQMPKEERKRKTARR